MKPSAAHPPKENVKETIISVIIAFAMAFVFRSFVAEAFIIPTGSMAPTLNGAHMRFTSPYTGQDWAVTPWYFMDQGRQSPFPGQVERQRQLGGGPTITVHDPVTGLDVSDHEGRARAGDRIFVLKYLYGIQTPEPFDVVVFKNPTNPDENYIKRLIALPGEQVAIVDGDVFVRKAPGSKDAEANPWEASDWTIRRKPATAQRAVWQQVFDSSLMTGDAVIKGAKSPWVATGATEGPASATYKTSGSPATIAWDRTRTFVARGTSRGTSSFDRTREINDRYAYNESEDSWNAMPNFPVGDIRIRTRVLIPQGSDASKLSLAGAIDANSHRFTASMSGGKAVLSMRGADEGSKDTVLAEAPLPAFSAGKAVAVEFWHADQQLQLWIEGKLVVSKGYDWRPMERLQYSLTPEAWAQFTGQVPSRSSNILADPSSYRTSGARWETSGTPVEFTCVGLDRDLHYRAATHSAGPHQRTLAGTPGTATHPTTTLTLKDDQFFVCGDNSPQSLDARLWGFPDPWVAAEFDPSPSVVSRRLLMGKAFFVYFPAPVGGSPVGVPDFGRLRFIR